MKFLYFFLIVFLLSCATTNTAESVCMQECENGYRYCMQSCNQGMQETTPNYFSSKNSNFKSGDAGCASRCTDIFNACKKNCDNTIPASYSDETGAVQTQDN